MTHIWGNPAVRWGGGILAVLIVTGLVWQMFVGPQMEEQRREKLKWEQAYRETEKIAAEFKSVATQAVNEKATLEQRLNETSQRLANVDTRITRDIVQVPVVRLVQVPGGSPAPVVVTTPGAPAPAPVSTGLDAHGLVSVIREVIDIRDRSSETKTANSEVKMATETMKTATEMASGKVEMETMKTGSEKLETEKTVMKRPVEDQPSRFGLAISDSLNPTATFDAFSGDLGPKFLKLGRWGAGGFVEGNFFNKDDSGFIRDYGLQGNLSRGRGFIFGGYGFKREEFRLGIGLKL